MPLSPPHADAAVVEPPLPAQEHARAEVYALLAQLLLAPADAALLQALARAPALRTAAGVAEGALATQWDALRRAAAAHDAGAVAAQYEALFVSAGQPLLDPYASRYEAGALMETPLAALRATLARLGLRRRAGAGEPEDHLGALCEVMRLLIIGAPGLLPRRGTAVQRGFFDAHLAPWAGRCLDDIAQAAGGGFYAVLADFMQAFLALEALAFDLDTEDPAGTPLAA